MVRGRGKFFPFAIAILVFLLDVPIGSAHVPSVEDSESTVFFGDEVPAIAPLICGKKNAKKTAIQLTRLWILALQQWISAGGMVSGPTPTLMASMTGCNLLWRARGSPSQ